MTERIAEPNEDFVDLLATFVAEAVDFVVVGAYALAAHGFPRATARLKDLADAELLERVTEPSSRG